MFPLVEKIRIRKEVVVMVSQFHMLFNFPVF